MQSLLKFNLNGGLKRMVSTLICLMMVLATFPIHMLKDTVSAAGEVSIPLTLTNSTGSEVKDWSNGELKSETVAGASNINITLSDNITVTNTTNKMGGSNFFNFTDTRFAGKTITIDGGSHTIKIAHDSLFFLNLKDCRVILKNITIDGGWIKDGDKGINRSGPFINVSKPSSGSESELEIEEGTTIQNCKNSSNSGGAIFNSGTLTVNAGIIIGCSAKTDGGAIHNDGALIINGGSITDCKGNKGGAMYNVGTLTINGGDVTSCSSNSGSGGAIYNDAIITINDGSITACSVGKHGGAIGNNVGIITINGGNITGCSAKVHGGAIANDKTGIIIINGVSIKDCKADSEGNGKGDGDAIYNGGCLKLPPEEFGFLMITLAKDCCTKDNSYTGIQQCNHNDNPQNRMGYEGIKGNVMENPNYKIVFVDESNPPEQLNTCAVMASKWDYVSVSNLNIMDGVGVRYVNKAGKETFVAVKNGKFQLTRDMVDSAKNGVITFKVKFGASASDTVKYVASGGHMILDKKSKLTNYSGVSLPIGGLRKVHEPKKVIFDFCGQTIHHNDPNVPFIQGVPGKHIVICNLNMDGSGCK